MNSVTLALISIRGLALSMSLAGRTAEADQLFKLGDLIVLGIVTDAHMQEVADLLAERTATASDIARVISSIETERTKLHAD